MRKIIICFILIFIILNNCSKDHYSQYYENYRTFKKFSETEKWEFKEFSDGEYLLPPYPLIIIQDKYLILGPDDSEKIKMIKIYRLGDRKCLKAFGEKGKGPGEFIYITEMLVDPKNKNKFWVYDIGQNRFSIFNIKTIINTNNFKPDTIMKINLESGKPTDFCILGRDTIVATGIFVKNRLCFYNSKLNPVKTVGNIPGNISNKFEKYQYVQTTNIVKNPERKRIAFGSNRGDILELYTFQGKAVNTIHGPNIIKPVWIDKKSQDNTPKGYFDLCSSFKYIYCVYSGEKQKKKSDWLAGLGKNIFVFDWDGNPIKRIRTKQRVCDIIISESRNIMYAVYYDGEYFRIGYHQL